MDPVFLLALGAAALAVATEPPAEAVPELRPEAELLSHDQLLDLVRSLAGRHRMAPGKRAGLPLLKRLRESARSLFRAYRDVAGAAERREPLTPAAEWLLDNFHIVEEQLAETRRHLPKQYYADLPKLEGGPYAGFPRVYALARELVAHTDGALDVNTLCDCVKEYQETAPLGIGELWAVPIMLRVSLLESLSALAAPLEESRLARMEADGWAERLVRAAADHPAEITELLGDLARRRTRLTGAHVVRLLQRLRGRGPAMSPVLDWLAARVEERTDSAIDDYVRLETYAQATDQVSISNTIGSFRLLDQVPWDEFFESTSMVDRELAADETYAGSDFPTRDACRHAVERIARRTKVAETRVAALAVELARGAASGAGAAPALAGIPDPRANCAPYYLIDDGTRELERRLGYRPTLSERLERLVRAYPTLFYLGGIIGFALLLVALAVAYAADHGAGPALLALTAVVGLLPASDLAVAGANWLVTRRLAPRVLAKRDFRGGIPAGCETLVAVPTLLTDAEGVEELVERLEIHYLANPDPSLRFALLTDFADAAHESEPGDEALLQAAVEGILRLNARYEKPEKPGPFYLLHRRRVRNDRQGCWMGWERKRGKLMEVNRWLRGDTGTTFTVTIGNLPALPDVRYVLCLDSDTRLPPDAARRLIGTLAHPLNVPVIDPTLRRVVRGHAVLQPRVSITLTSAARSLFTRVFSGNAGVDPYTTAVSDVYQDLFGEGVFCGKGLYEIDAFQAVLEGRIAENTLLSHDLFEGSFARCGLATDVELFDDYPLRYDSCSARQHRWIRGDWQLLRWLLPRVRQEDGRSVPNPLSVIARWKMLDNLRRSLVAPGLVLFLAAGWLWLPGSALVWTLLSLVAIAAPIFAHLAGAMLFDPRSIPWGSYFWSVWDDLATNAQQVALSLTFLSHQAFVSLDAVGRTLGRMFGAGRGMLEWQTAAEAERRLGKGLGSFARRMWAPAALSVLLAGAILWLRPENMWLAAPFLLLWLLSPVIAYWVSLPVQERIETFSVEERAMLHRAARRTWRFFEDVVTERDGWLPPDNYQADRADPIAHRTSPTNVGLLLLSTLTARDFGYVGVLELVERLERTLRRLDGMERYRGHFYNWYETLECTPILPFYVSTVDSGNLAGHLLAVKQACVELRDQPLFGPRSVEGLRDTLQVVLDELPTGSPWLRAECADVSRALGALAREGFRQPSPLAPVSDAVARLAVAAGTPGPAEAREAGDWVRLLASQTAGLQRDLDAFFPWSQLLVLQPAPFSDGRPLAEGRSGRAHAFPVLLAAASGDAVGPMEMIDRILGGLAEARRLRAGLNAATLPVEAEKAAGEWLEAVRLALEASLPAWVGLAQRAEALASLSSRLFAEMDFGFLYDEDRDLFVVGYDVAEARMDAYHYDLLASECRLASFIAIAKGDVPQKHWFRMGRALSQGRGERALISWGGTMFEYLMPSLVMRAHAGTLLSQTLPAVVRRQQEFGVREGVPWGISESGFAARDPQMNYQYRSFGVPGLGLNPDLFHDLVVCPYATFLALAVAPKAATKNLEALARAGLSCVYGFYEAIDYTPSRVKPGHHGEVVRELMAHHQGMSLVSLGNALLETRMPDRFHAEPLVKAAELLLEERNPRRPATAHPLTQQLALARTVVREAPPSSVRHYTTAQTSTPRVQLLSNGHYAVTLTAGGGGFSSWDSLAVTRWREDATRDHWGQFVYVRDLRSGKLWSITHQPVCQAGDDYDVYFTEDKAQFERRSDGLIQRLEVAVSSEDNAEVRRITLINPSDTPRELEIASYAEVVLAAPAADQAHPAFSNLFVETEYVPEQNALLATRRPRSAQQARVWAVHVLAHEGIPADVWGDSSYETDRARFLGRGRTPAAPESLGKRVAASRSAGPVLDPIFSLRQKVRLGPRQTVQLAFTTGVANSREEALLLAERYRDLALASRTFELAWLHSQIELRQLNLTSDQASLCQRLASRLLYVDSYVRAPGETLALNTQGQSGLWALGISGDLPLVLAQVSSFDQLPLVQELLLAHTYLRRKGLAFDLVLLNEHPPGYLQHFEQSLQDTVRNEGAPVDQPGGVFVRRAEHVADAGRNLLRFVARAVFSGLHGPLSDQLDWRPEPTEAPAAHLPSRNPVPPEPLSSVRPDLELFNGLGGFSRTANEYSILLERGQWTPAPWSNVIANERFGFVASEAGPGFTWSENSRENRLTPWSNDPVSDPPGEAIYLRNESTGRYWSVTPLPARDNNPYSASHGAGYTRYEHQSHGLAQELLLFVPPEDPVKIYRLRVRNQTERVQELTATFYAEWVLGAAREQNQAFVCTALDSETGALFARNSYSPEFSGRVAFADVDRTGRSWTSDRTEFLGRNGSLERPRAMARASLSGTAGAALDPCAAIRVRLTLQPGAETEVVFTLGQGADAAEARTVLRKYRSRQAVSDALHAVRERWTAVLGAVQVRTPDPAFDRLLNQWLLYQVLSCRVWARSALYQSGGAYGFRDQLQDVMALSASGCPEAVDVARRQILLHAGRQFAEGDVQHWWHPPSGRGIRTRFSDDLLWLPFVTAHYLRATGDLAILDETAPFLLGRLLAEGEDEYYDLPAVSMESATLYEHCLRALRRGMTEGAHGLPLMGTGDWNDGMNLIGHHGRGESVWVAWFLMDVLRQFAPVSRERGDPEQAAQLLAQAERYRVAVEAEAWDGDWYRRAYFDDGTPLGSKANDECRIDAIAQSWAVISGAGDPARARQAMAAVEERLVREKDGLILLFTPPFDQGELDPGYIKGYVPGVRENGGQYTHAALWTVLATALQGHGGRAHELFSLLNPIRHAETPEQCAVYRVEPYVVAADVYGGAPHVGRGGWTWYTGSASWMYRIGLESLLGFRLEGDAFTLDPCIPAAWPGFELTHTHHGSRYHVLVRNPNGVERGVSSVTLNGAPCPGGRVAMKPGGGDHEVIVVMG